MNKHKKIIIGVIIVLLIIFIGKVVAYNLIENSVTNREDFKLNVENISPTPVNTINQEENISSDPANTVNQEENISSDPANTINQEENINNQVVTWEEITKEGVNEELLLENVDTELLTQIATELQTLISEEEKQERENPEILITEGWTRVFKSERYKRVLNIGNSAMKPLYLIIYKSSNAGIYEYICATALYELSGFSFEWADSKEFLEKFNNKIIEERQ